eukprot:1166259-Pyramimonas_sp.AAC.1
MTGDPGDAIRQPDFGEAMAAEAEPVTMAGIAALLQQQLAPVTIFMEDLNKKLGTLNGKVGNLAVTLGIRLGD